MTNNKNRELLWTLPYVIVAFGLLFAFMGLSEFYNAKIDGQESAYAFGPVNENQWYYQNASIYASYNLTSGLIFLALSFLTVWAIIKKNKTLIVWCICLTILLFIAELISSDVQ